MPDSPAALLDRASQALRDAANAATHNGRTVWRLGNTLGTKTLVVLDDPDKPTVLIETYAERLERVNAYLTLVGPATGLALADWLEGEASAHRANRQAAQEVWPNDSPAQEEWIARRNNPQALAVARAILGEPTS